MKTFKDLLPEAKISKDSDTAIIAYKLSALNLWTTVGSIPEKDIPTDGKVKKVKSNIDVKDLGGCAPAFFNMKVNVSVGANDKVIHLRFEYHWQNMSGGSNGTDIIFIYDKKKKKWDK